jgi:hypothetical protein
MPEKPYDHNQIKVIAPGSADRAWGTILAVISSTAERGDT